MIKEIFTSPNDGNYMFGYFDKSQISNCQRFYACLKVTKLDSYYKKNEFIEIGYFDQKSVFNKIDKSSAFNFQQGCMLNWISFKNKRSLIYNIFEGETLCARIYNLDDNKYYNLKYPLYSLSKNSNFFLTINFCNLYKFKPGYSYDLGDNKIETNYHSIEELGIWMYNLQTEKIKKIISAEDLGVNNKDFWIEHINISPDNFNFIFLLREKLKDGGVNTSFYLSDINKSKLFKINNSGRASHFNWFNKNEFIVYGGLENYANKLRKNKFLQKLPFNRLLLSIYHKFIKHNSNLSKKITGDCYFIYNINNLTHKKINSQLLNLEDGHPSIDTKINRYLLTDIYSDLPAKKPKLLILDLYSNQIVYEISFDSIKQLDNSPFRCDLHPRFLDNELLFSIDCFINNRRAFKVFKFINE